MIFWSGDDAECAPPRPGTVYLAWAATTPRSATSLSPGEDGGREASLSPATDGIRREAPRINAAHVTSVVGWRHGKIKYHSQPWEFKSIKGYQGKSTRVHVQYLPRDKGASVLVTQTQLLSPACPNIKSCRCCASSAIVHFLVTVGCIPETTNAREFLGRVVT
ncbi:hypothetical protein E2C01_040670 [Portunus trituberculatus]|uniref:Uncharacterized protein n=1 Tax=Portunus trituberculatus TaxID=210409 RepID=A0A5B7FNV0_PORTR|nr:hypothetical protein [Portunus trituberculatus]